jgi:hypothetical protein
MERERARERKRKKREMRIVARVRKKQIYLAVFLKHRRRSLLLLLLLREMSIAALGSKTADRVRVFDSADHSCERSKARENEGAWWRETRVKRPH